MDSEKQPGVSSTTGETGTVNPESTTPEHVTKEQVDAAKVNYEALKQQLFAQLDADFKTAMDMSVPYIAPSREQITSLMKLKTDVDKALENFNALQAKLST